MHLRIDQVTPGIMVVVQVTPGIMVVVQVTPGMIDMVLAVKFEIFVEQNILVEAVDTALTQSMQLAIRPYLIASGIQSCLKPVALWILGWILFRMIG